MSKRKLLGVGNVDKPEAPSIAAQGKYLAIDGAARIASLLFEIVLERDDCRPIDGVIRAVVNKRFEEVEIDPVALDRLLTGLINAATVIKKRFQVLEEGLVSSGVGPS